MSHERRANQPGELLHQRELLRCLDRRQRIRKRAASQGQDVDRLDVLDVLVLIHSNREIFILHDAPAKDPNASQDKLGRLQLCLYGTRDAALNWQQTLSDHLVENGFVRGVGHLSVFHHATRDIWTLVHGDDYCSAGAGADLDWFEDVPAKNYEIKSQRIGRGKTKDGKDKAAEGQVPHRVVRSTDIGFELEADLRHAELIIEQFGL